jgi:hypothetical protein
VALNPVRLESQQISIKNGIQKVFNCPLKVHRTSSQKLDGEMNKGKRRLEM